jgi:NADPH:quinone reductase-like Zn-dependent oxidoreductase
MRAVRYDRYGPPDVLHVADIPLRAPAAGEVSVRIHAASLNPLDWKIRAGHLRRLPMFSPPPRTVGVDLAGDIVATGGGPGPRHVGERVFGSLPAFGRDGSCAEFAIIAARRLAPIPQNASYEACAALPVSAGTAVQAFVDDAPLSAGQRVLINGAAGGVGHFAVQVAKHLGAHVVATCSATNVEFVRSLGADDVLDYSTADIAAAGPFDVIFDVADTLSWQRAAALLGRGGRYVSTAGTAKSAIGTVVAGLAAPFSGKQAHALILKDGGASCARLGEWLERGALHAHIASRVPLDGVAEAQRRMESGHAAGKTLVFPANE